MFLIDAVYVSKAAFECGLHLKVHFRTAEDINIGIGAIMETVEMTCGVVVGGESTTRDAAWWAGGGLRWMGSDSS